MRADLYRTKIIRSGRNVEIYSYETYVKVNYKRKKRIAIKRNKCDFNENTKIYIRDSSLRRTRSRIKRIIQSNDDFKTFLTLTFKENITELEIANKCFHNFIKRLKRIYQDLKYLAVPEFQKRGAVHYHILLNIAFISNEKLAKIWGHGFVMINEIKLIDNIGAYVAKYLQKSLFDKRYFGMRKFFYSRNLKKPTVAIFTRNVAIEIVAELGKSKIVYENTFNSDQHGKVNYTLLKI